ncbi:MAG: hypothetical protein RL179_544 [Planctomycetota bacterium]
MKFQNIPHVAKLAMNPYKYISYLDNIKIYNKNICK